MPRARDVLAQWAGGRHHRSEPFSGDISLVSEVIGLLAASREGAPVPVDQLPITQGIALLISDAVADMRLYATRGEQALDVDEASGQLVDDGRYRTFPVLEQPNPEECRADTVHKLAQSLYWSGNAWALQVRPDPADAAIAITVVNPTTVGPVIDPLDRLRVDWWLVEGHRRERSELAWWKYADDPRRGPLGESPLRRCETALSMYGWAYRYLAGYFEAGGNPSGILKSRRALNDAEALKHGDDWVAARQKRRPAVLPMHLDFDVPRSTGDLGEALEVLGHAAAEVARMSNIPPSLVNAPVTGYSLTYANVGDEFKRWLAVSLRPTWLSRLERGFTSLLPYGYWAHFDPSAMFHADLFPLQAQPQQAAAPTIGAPA